MEEVLEFWFETLSPKDWWTKNDELDTTISNKFGELLEQAARGELSSWRDGPMGRLAEIIVLDQFSRNIHRGKPESFAQDALALKLAQECVACGDDKKLAPEKRAFVYMPYIHSESLEVHDEAVKLFEDLGNQDNLKFEHAHRDIIQRFGRYPHRNKVLGRESTPEELEFLTQPGSSF